MNLSKAHTESLLRTVILVQNTSQSGVTCNHNGFYFFHHRLTLYSIRSLLPLVGLYVVYTAIDGNALNIFRNSSGGSEIHQVGLEC